MFSINSTQKAKQHIKEIRKDFDLTRFGPSRHVTNLERALDLLSDQLYQKPTHFLLELIQNADDNEYSNDTPTLTFNYEGRKLRIDCNEKGFSKANVEAICRIGHSTKSAHDGATRYVGEKGIGFKSVFKVADKVWISSNGYTFKFDKSQPLGMIAPIWEDFPQPTIAGVTSMLLELSPLYDETKLIMELKTLDTRMLIFLRKLCEINVHVKQPGFWNPWLTKLRKSSGNVKDGSNIVLIQDSKTFSYRISRHEVRNMPSDPKREGLTKSEILLAFPMLSDDKKELDHQQVYAFLPIRDYGFKFLLQGDFLLSASREDVLSDSPWNVALRDCFVDAFVGLVQSSHQSFLKYHWPRFLPVDSLSNGFFETARKSIIDRLSRSLVMKNSLEKLVVPNQVMQVPEEYRTREGVALLAFGSASTLHLSDQYAKPCLEPLEKLGVRKMDLKDFVKTLQNLLATDFGTFQKRPNSWHSELARRLLAALWKSDLDTSQWKIVRGLPIVQLEQNQWVAASEAGVFLPPDTKEDLQFDGIEIKMVVKEAATDVSRAALYKDLRIPVISQTEICRYIADSLSRKGVFPPSVTGDKLVSQTIFLFKAGWRNTLGQDLWFENQTADFDRGSCLYIPSSSKYSTSHYYGQNKRLFLHQKYFEAAQTMSINIDEFKQWLEDCMHVWEIPRLMSITSAHQISQVQFRVSWEFGSVARSDKEPSWIYLLRDNFRKYSTTLDLNEVLKNKLYASKIGNRSAVIETSYQDFLKSIGNLPVKCKGQKIAALQGTYLPHKMSQNDRVKGVPILDVPDPEHNDWQYLKNFGLGLEPDLMMYLRCLERLSQLSVDAGKQANYLIDQIQARSAENIQMVRQYFTEKPLIWTRPVSESSRPRWLKAQQCLWAGGECFRRLPALKQQYPGKETLFRQVLGIKDAKLDDLYREALLLRVGDDLEHIHDIFVEIENRLREEEPDPQNFFSRFAVNNIFPVISSGGKAAPRSNYDMLQKIASKVEWYIADRQNLRDSFSGRLPLLTLSVGMVQNLKRTMDKMKLDRYRLSRCAQSRAETNGSSVFEPNLTADMLKRVPYMLRLIPPMVPIRTKRRIARQLRSLRIQLAENLIQEWSVVREGGQVVIPGRPYRSNVVFTIEKNDALRIFLSRKYLASSVCKNDIVQHFADFCETRDNTHLLTMTLWEGLEEVEATFLNLGIPEYDPLIDTDDPLDGEESDILELEKENAEDTTSIPEPDSGVEIEFPGIDDTIDDTQQQNLGDSFDVVCPHCATGRVKFTVAGIKDIFGAGSSGTSSPGQFTPQTPQSGSARSSRSFPISFKILGPSLRSGLNGSRPSSGNLNDIGLQYNGENFFSATLASFLGTAYNPSTHWTSTLRTRAGHPPFAGSAITHAAFTLPDPSGTVTNAMLRENPEWATHWAAHPPTWHFEVKTTAGGLDSPFYLTNEQVDRAREFTATNLTTASQVPKNITVLVRVFNADGQRTPDATLYRDPWEMFLVGDLAVKADGLYRCNVNTLPPPYS